ncbi:MAG: XRE family transcriptional regulator [Methylobacteriaceae bacterium]|nr:XRE family transcriptional regulator [Methylobacteriaceae bacterium]MBV9247108.1 XRE family transcriptional regulator [Methylobacteriaceae bacterium]
MNLAEVRRALKLSQQEIGQTLQIGQGSVAKVEKRTDMYVSTPRRFIEAMGGELEIVARFPDHAVKIENFSDLDEEMPRSTKHLGSFVHDGAERPADHDHQNAPARNGAWTLHRE